MISIDKAKQLKELGLVWNPKRGDWHKADYWPTPTLFIIDTLRLDDKEIECVIENIKNRDDEVWLPSLDKMLDEIEKYNYIFSLVGEKITLFKKLNLIIQFECDNREDSVADALIWILKRR